MADPTTDDDDTGAASDAPSGVDTSADTTAEATSVPDAEAMAALDGAEVRKPVDPQADVAARRAATSARMDREGSSKGKVGATEAKGRPPAKAPMAKASAADPTGTRARREQAAATKRVPKPSKRTGGVDPKAARAAATRSGNPRRAAEAAESSRYTAPIPRSHIESPTWVPALMFTLLGAGGAVVLLTYVLWAGRPLTLGIGLALILGGILTATQYR